MPEARPALKKGLLIKVGVLGVAVLVVGALMLRGVDLKALLVQVMAVIGDAGPWVFFTGVALLPACGFPLMAFTLTAGPAFGAQLGLGGVLAAYGAAVGINLTLTYWLARYALRPWVERLVARAGYKIPHIEEKEHLEVTLLFRITPGPPFFLQSYLLGLGRVAFLTYLWVSWIGGDGLRGRGGALRQSDRGGQCGPDSDGGVPADRRHPDHPSPAEALWQDAPSLPSDDPGRVETVTEFTRRVKALLEGGIRPGWVRGEVSNLRAQASGHVYFSLKDAGAQLACVLFRGDALRQSVTLRDGLQVLAYGEVSVYEQRGQYQLIVRAVLEDGVGRLQQEFERLKQRLADEGLFDAARKDGDSR